MQRHCGCVAKTTGRVHHGPRLRSRGARKSWCGASRVDLIPGRGGAPRWPAGIVGSMTHCLGYRAATVAREQEFASLGIDTEPHKPLPPTILQTIASHGEIMAIRELFDPNVACDTLLFSAKEALSKPGFPSLSVSSPSTRFASASKAQESSLSCSSCQGRLLTGNVLVGPQDDGP